MCLFFSLLLSCVFRFSIKSLYLSELADLPAGVKQCILVHITVPVKHALCICAEFKSGTVPGTEYQGLDMSLRSGLVI